MNGVRIVVHDKTVNSDADGNIYVTRLNMYGKVNTYRLSTKEYTPMEVAHWLFLRDKLVQDAFPNMTADDREFLMTGITPAEWAAMFPKEEGDE
jgi:hypothetical protein